MPKKLSLILVDLFGHIIYKDASRKEIYEFVYNKPYNVNNSNSMLSCGFIKKKYILFRKDNPQKLYDQIKKLILVVSRKEEILGIYTSIIEAKKDEKLDLYSSERFLGRILKSGELSPADKVCLFTGDKALEMMKSQGYLNEVEQLINEGKGEDYGRN